MTILDTIDRTILDSLTFSPRAGFERELLDALLELSRTGRLALDERDSAGTLRPWVIVGSIAGAFGVGVAVYQWSRHHHVGRRAA